MGSCVKINKGRTEMETEEKLELDNDEIYSSEENVLNNAFKQQDKEIEESITKMVEDDATDLDEKDIEAVVSELRHLEEKLHLWREVRQNTIIRLREIADYIDSVAKQTGVAKVVGSGGGVLAGGLTVVGGVMTVLTAGAALPVLVAGAGLGLASGIAGGAAAITKKILESKQMSKVKVAIEVDSAATSELVSEIDIVKNDTRVTKVAGMVFTVGGLASGTKGLLDAVRGATAAEAQWYQQQLAQIALIAGRKKRSLPVPGTIPGLVPGSVGEAQWYQAQLEHIALNGRK